MRTVLKLRYYRNIAGISTEKFARIMNVSTSLIGRVEREEIKPNKKLMQKIANYFGIDKKELLKKIPYKYEFKKEKIKEEKPKPFKCLNQACLFNKGCMCTDCIVIKGKAPCFGKDKIKDKPIQVDLKSTHLLFNTNKKGGEYEI